MKRSKKIILSCHCLLNQNARAQTVAKRPGVVPEFVAWCVKRGYGIVPLGCPQLLFEPLKRKPATKETYSNEQARAACRKIVHEALHQTRLYRKAGYEVVGIMGVEGSPTCGAVRTHVLKNGTSVSVRERGIFFEELDKALKRASIKLPIMDWDIQVKKPIFSN